MKKANLQIILYICSTIILFSMAASEAAESTAGTSKDPSTAIKFVAPTGLTAMAAGQYSVDIRWDTMNGATEYYIYRNGRIVNRVSGARYRDKDLNHASVYRYQIQAIYETGESARSESKCVRTWQKPNEGTGGSVVCPPSNLRIVVAN